MKKKILLIMPKHASIHELIIKNIECVGYDVTFFSEPDFKYKSIGQRLDNFFRKTFLGQKDYKDCLKMQYREQAFIRDIYSSQPIFDFALVIRPDLYGENIPKYLKKICKKIIAYQWDGFSRFKLTDNIINSYDTFAVFDNNDFKQYSTQYPHLISTNNFYFDYLPTPAKKYDFYYIGTLQDDRLEVITRISNMLKQGEFNNSFTLFDITGKQSKKHPDIRITHKAISYKEILKNSSEFSVIIDLKTSCHNGLSLRFFEALHFSQKIITNNETVKDTDFYHENNHLVFNTIDQLNYETLVDFLQKPYIKPSDDIVQKYSFINWLKSITA